MGIDEEVYVLRENRPIFYLRFRNGLLCLSFEDEELFKNDPIRIEEVDIIGKRFTGYWMSGEDFLKILDKLEKFSNSKQTIDYLRNEFKESPVLPTDRVLYKIETG